MLGFCDSVRAEFCAELAGLRRIEFTWPNGAEMEEYSRCLAILLLRSALTIAAARAKHLKAVWCKHFAEIKEWFSC